jgi:hypothetical protein
LSSLNPELTAQFPRRPASTAIRVAFATSLKQPPEYYLDVSCSSFLSRSFKSYVQITLPFACQLHKQLCYTLHHISHFILFKYRC